MKLVIIIIIKNKNDKAKIILDEIYEFIIIDHNVFLYYKYQEKFTTILGHKLDLK